ncbi:MAG: benzoate/toluate 1,2-dioxygenase alpha subunit [Gammaproteobacteria bacterium]
MPVVNSVVNSKENCTGTMMAVVHRAHFLHLDEGADMNATVDPSRGVDFSALIDDRPADKVFRVDRAIYTDRDVFEAELEQIFEGSWVYLAHESQLPNVGDFFTTWMGRQPVIVNRLPGGEVSALINACSHRGARVVNTMQGNATTLTCPYHGWCYDPSGRCTKRKEERSGWGGRPAPENVDLKRVARVESFRGFIFGSLRADVPDLVEHLGQARVFIEQLADQSPQGMEVVPGYSSYIVDGNWKLQAENGVDGYHVSTVHRNFATTMGRRNARKEADAASRTEVDRFSGRVRTGAYDLDNGHNVLWAVRGNPEVAPLFEARAQVEPEVGAVKWEWMCGRGRNLLLYPNLFLMDQSSTQIRVLRPLAADRTEVTVFCIAPIGESRAARKTRLAKFRDFFLMSGLATADDSVVLEETQFGAQGSALTHWNLYDRGLDRVVSGPDDDARELGIEPVTSAPTFDHEAIYHGQYRRWRTLMVEGANE